jgi:CRISPR-associated RAMP protein, Csm3 family
MSHSIQLKSIINFYIKLENTTGLLISAGRSLGRIGGSDVEPVSIEREYKCENKQITVRVPYIPGSSIKGRMRSLLEVALGLKLYSSDKKIWSHTLSMKVYKNFNESISVDEFVKELISTDLDKVFGYGAFQLNEIINAQLLQSLLTVLTPTSFLVEDFFPEENVVCSIYKENGIVTFDDFLEDKNENRIDRITSTADPRTISRVKPGVAFTGKFSILIYDKSMNKIVDYVELIKKGMGLLENTYLGAAGSRGYGRVKFKEVIVGVYNPKTMEEEEVGKYENVEKIDSNKISEVIKKFSVK